MTDLCRWQAFHAWTLILPSPWLACGRRREEQGAKLRKTAEKLLLNQLKKHALGKMSEAQQATVLQAQQSTALDADDEIPADLRVSELHAWAVELSASALQYVHNQPQLAHPGLLGQPVMHQAIQLI